MHCSSCGTQLLEGKRFCHICGAAAGTSCPHCGAAVSPGFAFCPDCGRPLAAENPAPAEGVRTGPDEARAVLDPPAAADSTPSAPDRAAVQSPSAPIAGERKQVTVLFCDLEGSTAIAEQLDPEDYRDLLDRYLELAIREIDRLGGFVNQLAGDGFMALFGAPVALEDEPARAISAGLAIQRQLADLNHSRSDRGEPELVARIGIHTGPVVVGTVGNDLKMDYTAIGDTTNLAARLQSLAQPGGVLVSTATSSLVAGRFELRELPEIEVKGKSEPITAYAVVGEADAVTPMQIAEARGLTPLVGLSEELAQLEACFDRISGELPQLVSVLGGPGSGKSRLVYEFKRRLESRDAVLFEARGAALTQSVPFAPLRTMMKEFFALAPGEDPECACEKIAEGVRPFDADLTNVYPTMCRLLTVPGDDQSPEGEREATMHAFTRLLEGVMSHRSALIILEDLHWFDEASRELLELQIARMDRYPIMVLVTHRPDYQPAWQVRTAHTQLTLRPFIPAQTLEIVRLRAGGELPGELEQLIVQRSEGNPFFAEEITRALLDEGHVVQEDGGARLVRPVDSIQIPNTVQELIEARLDRLTPRTKRVAQVASVVGRQFREDHVAQLVAGEQIDVRDALAELEDLGLIHRVGEGEHRFGESLTQSVSYEGLLMKERRELHERIAALIEADPRGMTSERAGLIAHHLARSENRSKAIDSLLAAARDAEDLPSYPSATKLYRQALELAEQVLASEQATEQARRWVLNASIGICRVAVLYSVPDRQDEERIALRGAEMAEALEDTSALSNMINLRAMIVSRGDGTRFAEGMELMQQAQDLAKRGGHRLALVSSERALAYSYLRDGQFAKAHQSLEAVRTELEALGQHDPPSDLYLSIAYFESELLLNEDKLQAVIEIARATHETCVRISNRTIASGTASILAHAHYELGQYAEAKSWADRALQMGREIGGSGSIRAGIVVGMGARLELGENPGGARMLEPLDQTLSQSADLGTNVTRTVEVLLQMGEIERAMRFADAGTLRAGGRLRQMQSLLATAHTLAARGPAHHAEAREEFALAAAVAAEIGSRSSEIEASIGLARLQTREGELERAAEALSDAAEVAEDAGLGRLRDLALRGMAEARGMRESEADTIQPRIN